MKQIISKALILLPEVQIHYISWIPIIHQIHNYKKIKFDMPFTPYFHLSHFPAKTHSLHCTCKIHNHYTCKAEKTSFVGFEVAQTLPCEQRLNLLKSHLPCRKTDLSLWFSTNTNKSRAIKLPLIQFVQLYIAPESKSELYAISINTHLALYPVNSWQQMHP